MKKFAYYLRLWIKLTLYSFAVSFTSKTSAAIFLLGKSLRFIFMIVFLFVLFSRTVKLADYTVWQAFFFYLTFVLIDTLTQLFYREVYRFRPLVVSGDFDLVLAKPMNPLFRALAGGADPLDFFMLIPYVGMLIYIVYHLGGISMQNVLLYVGLLINGFLIATAFHILVLALAVLTTEIDHAIMIYRDLTSMGRVPVDIYREPLRSVITFIIPIGIMMTFPAKAFLGLLSPFMIFLSLVLGSLFLFLSIRIWRFALSQYSSASS